MTTIDQVKKHYDKLTARERFALVVAAGARDDQAETKALISAAPRKHWSMPDTYGLSEGFEALTNHHLMQQLGTAGTFFMLVGFEYNQDKTYQVENAADGETFTPDDAIELTARRFMEGLEAYKTVCQEYGIDPETLTDRRAFYPELLTMAELVIWAAYKDDPLELADLGETIEAYKTVIEHYCREWA